MTLNEKESVFATMSGSSCKRTALPTATISKSRFNSHTNSVFYVPLGGRRHFQGYKLDVSFVFKFSY